MNLEIDNENLIEHQMMYGYEVVHECPNMQLREICVHEREREALQNVECKVL